MAVFLQKLCQKKSLFDILNRKQSFLDQKLSFPKGLDHEFCPNIEVFVIGVFTEINLEKTVFYIVEGK